MLSSISTAYFAFEARAATPPPVALSRTVDWALIPDNLIISRAGGPVTSSLVKTTCVTLGTVLKDMFLGKIQWIEALRNENLVSSGPLQSFK